MLRESLRALCLSAIAVAARAGGMPLDDFLEPNRGPLLPKISWENDEERYVHSSFRPFANGDYFEQFAGAHDIFVTAKQPQPRPQPRPPIIPQPRPPIPPGMNPAPPPPVRPPPQPRPYYNPPPKRVVPPTMPPPMPRGGTKIPWMQIVGQGEEGYPTGGDLRVSPLDDDFVLEAAWLHTETGARLPMSVALITDLALLPTVLDLGQGPVLIEWDLTQFTQTTGRFYLLRADVRLDVLFLPEPSGLMSLLMASALMWPRVRRALR